MHRETPSCRIVVADFCPILAEAVARALSEDLGLPADHVCAVASLDVETICRAAPEILIVDPLHAAPLLEFRDALRARLPELRFVAYAAQPSASLARYCIDLDFNAFLSKAAQRRSLSLAVGVVCRGGSFIDRNFGLAAMRADCDSRGGGSLTTREERVLRLIANGYSNSTVAERLSLSTKTVDSHKSRAMKKLDIPDRPALIRFAVSAGWLG